MGLECTDSVAVLDALAPQPGWETDLALFSSYSVDLVAVAAIVVALAGEGEDDEQVRRASLARACYRLRDRFRVVCQAGRVVRPSSGADTLVIADRWIREVRLDENERSWHAKLALVRYRSVATSETEVEWRLWVGSRNLTRDTSWDSALTALGKVSAAHSDSIDRSVARIGAVLADQASLPEWSAARVEGELRRIHWEWPQDIREVVSFSMWPDAQAATGFPKPPRGLDHVVAVSPFVNGSIASALSQWDLEANRQLLTTPSTLAALAGQDFKSLAGFSSLHQLEVPAGTEDVHADYQEEAEDDQMVEVHRGLHAKLLWARGAEGDELWLGSANLTERAWNGRNTEAVVHARVMRQVGDGLVDGLVNGIATQVRHNLLVSDPPNENGTELALGRLRNRIAGSWNARLERDEKSGTFLCEAQSSPLRNVDEASLSVRFLGQTDWVDWESRATAVKLPALALHRQTELLEFELRSNQIDDIVVSWVARAEMDPPPDFARDQAVLARLMGPKAFLTWLRALLDDVRDDSGCALWPETTSAVGHQLENSRMGGTSVVSRAPTLESVLRAWIRTPEAVRRVDLILEPWIREIRDAFSEDPAQDEREALQQINHFEAQWRVIREGLELGGPVA